MARRRTRSHAQNCSSEGWAEFRRHRGAEIPAGVQVLLARYADDGDRLPLCRQGQRGAGVLRCHATRVVSDASHALSVANNTLWHGRYWWVAFAVVTDEYGSPPYRTPRAAPPHRL